MRDERNPYAFNDSEPSVEDLRAALDAAAREYLKACATLENEDSALSDLDRDAREARDLAIESGSSLRESQWHNAHAAYMAQHAAVVAAQAIEAEARGKLREAAGAYAAAILNYPYLPADARKVDEIAIGIEAIAIGDAAAALAAEVAEQLDAIDADAEARADAASY